MTNMLSPARLYLAIGFVIGLTLVTAVVSAHPDPGTASQDERIGGLIRQLGHDEFPKREAASKELEAIGEPALEALRKAMTDRDPEIRRRAERIAVPLIARLGADAAKNEIARWQGDWHADGDFTLTIKGDQWVSNTPAMVPIKGTLRAIGMREKTALVDLVVNDGPTKGHVCRIIFRLDGNTLHYCGTYDPQRPTEFKSIGNSVYTAWKRGKLPPKPAVAQHVELMANSEAFSTDLPLAESKQPIHRVAIDGQLGDGGKATLTLDPNYPKFDRFGQPVGDAKRSPVLTFDVTFKFVKEDAGLRLYEIRGPKIVSKLYFTSGVNLPFRFLVHGDDGKVRYLVNLHDMPRFPPCHPGCFPAGTLVRVAGGTKPIERIQAGDSVTIIDADGKASPTKVTAVFTTRNRVLTLRVDGANLVTTETQPVALEAGGFRPASELKSGDRVWRWVDGKRNAMAVREVSAADRVVEVFNLVLGEPTGFIASDFVVRSKPPAANVAPNGNRP